MFNGFRRPQRKMPVTQKGLEKYDNVPAEIAVALAWQNKGNHPSAHEEAMSVVRDAMPLLARALDRMPPR